jgi:hypothetical protein
MAKLSSYLATGTGVGATSVTLDSTTNLTVISGSGTSITGGQTVSGISTFSSQVVIGSNILNIETTTTNLSSTTATSIIGISTSLFRSARVQLQITQGSNFQTSDVLLIHNGTSSSLIEYGSIATNDYLANFSTDISSNTARLLVSLGSTATGIGTTAVVKAAAYKIAI